MEHEKSKGRYLSLAVKALLVLLVVAAAFYFIYVKAIRGRALLIISDREIESASDDQKVVDYKTGGRVYFLVTKRMTSLNGSLVALEIEKRKGDEFVHHLRASYEIEKSFSKIASYIPEEYFFVPGKYRIKLYIDGKLMNSEDIRVGD